MASGYTLGKSMKELPQTSHDLEAHGYLEKERPGTGRCTTGRRRTQRCSSTDVLPETGGEKGVEPHPRIGRAADCNLPTNSKATTHRCTICARDGDSRLRRVRQPIMTSDQRHKIVEEENVSRESRHVEGDCDSSQWLTETPRG